MSFLDSPDTVVSSQFKRCENMPTSALCGGPIERAIVVQSDLAS